MNTLRMLKASLLALAALGCGACGATGPAPAPARPSPTIAVAQNAPVRATPLPSPTATLPPPSPTAPAAPAPTEAAVVVPGQPAPVRFTYLWPAYIPDGMFIAPEESRVAQENEIGTSGTGFYLVTLNGTGRKLVVGGGATDALPLAGEARELTVDGQSARLTTDGEQRLLVFPQRNGKIFLYSSGLDESELLLVAESLVPIELVDLRQQVRAPGA